MTQLFIGHKPGVGPVVKILKHDDDDPLTLANDAYDRYIFNSENQKIGYAFGLYSFDYWYGFGGVTSGTVGRVNINGDDDTAWFTGWAGYQFRGWDNKLYQNGDLWIVGYLRPDKVFPDRNILPIFNAAVRWGGDGPTAGFIECARRGMNTILNVTNREAYIFTSSQLSGGYLKVKDRVPGSDVVPGATGFNWEGRIQQFFPNIAIGEWVGMSHLSSAADGSATLANNYPAGAPYSGPPPVSTALHYYWSLPADQSPMPDYPASPGLEIVRLDGQRVAIARPGYDIRTDSGMSKMIVDSEGAAPALCIAAGVTPSIPAGSELAIPLSTPLEIGSLAVVETMVRGTDQEQYIPPHVLSGWVRNTRIAARYRIQDGVLTFFNDSSMAVVITYFVFAADEQPPSTGGQEVIWEGNDGTQDYFQIKRPGTTDPASRPADLLMDSRYPAITIIKEGWLPLAYFVANSQSPWLLGTHCVDVEFDAAGMIPFVKFMTVFPDYILPPVMSLAMTWQQGFSDNWGPVSNQSSLCRLRASEGVARFYLSPDNFTRMTASGDMWQSHFDGPAPLGIRYYILGIPSS